jgi:hypothetical protein
MSKILKANNGIRNLSNVSRGVLYLQIILKNYVRASISAELSRWRIGFAYYNESEMGEGHSIIISLLCFEFQCYFKDRDCFCKMNKDSSGKWEMEE